MNDKKNTKPTGSGSRKRLPWWLSVLLAIGSYCSLKFVIPGLHPAHPALQKLAQAAPTFAPIITILFLLLAAKQLYDIDADEDAKDKDDTPGEELDEEENEDPDK